MVAWRKKGVALLKIAISLILVYFVFTKVDFSEVWGILQNSRPVYIGLALICFVFSKVFSAFRLNLYFHRLDILLTQKSNLKLYLLGMFYNLFLPGGIGGDAYKGYQIKKKFEIPVKKVVAVLLLDRLSGMLLLFVYACLLAMALEQSLLKDYRILFIVGGILGVLVFWILNKRFFSYVLPVFWPSAGYSLLVQGLQLLSLYCILCGLAIENDMLAYLFVFFDILLGFRATADHRRHRQSGNHFLLRGPLARARSRYVYRYQYDLFLDFGPYLTFGRLFPFQKAGTRCTERQ